MKFASKIFIVIFLTTALVIGGLALFTHVWIFRFHIKNSIRYEKELATLVALKSDDYILRGDRIELYQFYQSILNVDPNVDYLFAEQQGEVIVSTFENGTPRGLLNLSPIKQPDRVDITPIETLERRVYHHFRKEIGNPVHAVLHFGVSDEKLRARLLPYRNLLFIVSLLLISTVPFGLAYLIANRVSSPLEILRDGVRRIGCGELDFRLLLPTGDEIEQLAEDINTMAGQLSKSRDGLEREITDRKHAQEELAKQTEILNTILNHAPVSVFWKDTELRYLGCNTSFAESAGLDHTFRIIGMNDDDLPWTHDEAERLLSFDKRVLSTGIPVYDREDTLTFLHNQKRTVIASTVPLKNREGRSVGLLGIFYDITERKRMEETLKQTQKMEAIGTLAGGIAHDFNNILAGIIGYTELAQDEAGQDNPAQEHLEQVYKSASRAKDLVRQILTFSRKSQEKRKPISMKDIVSEETKLLRSTLPATIEINCNIDEEAGMVHAESTQMHQIVMNLCTNAAHAMQPKGGTLSISLKPRNIGPENANQFPVMTPGPYVELRISDTGMGIDPKIIHRVFEPFFTTKDKESGTGMGLAVVHGIVKEYGGDITVTSKAGEGTTFTVLFPQAHSTTVTKSKQQAAAPGGREHILFVDDELTLLNLGKQILSSLGYAVTTCNGSLEALTTFRADPGKFDLVITDQTMPHMTGYDLSRQIMDIRPGLPVILCTGYSDTITKEIAEMMGIRRLLYKPMSKNEIAQAIRSVLDSPAASDDSKHPREETGPSPKKPGTPSLASPTPEHPAGG